MSTANQILRLPEVVQITGYSKPAIYLKIKQGTFPKQIKLGARASGWLAVDIQSWINDRIAASK